MVAREGEKERLDYLHSLGHDPIAERLGFAREIKARLASMKEGPEDVGAGGTAEILDVGTGRGYFSLILASLIPDSHISTIDISSEQLVSARETFFDAYMDDRVTFLQGDASRYCFSPGVFHAAAAYVSMHHMEHPGTVLSNMRGAAGEGGLVAIADYNREGLRMLAVARERFGQEGGHGHREIPAEELEDTLAEIFPEKEGKMVRMPGRFINYYFL